MLSYFSKLEISKAFKKFSYISNILLAKVVFSHVKLMFLGYCLSSSATVVTKISMYVSFMNL